MQLWLSLLTLGAVLAGLVAFSGFWPPLADLGEALFLVSLVLLMLSVVVAAWRGS